jgi:RHS repeat-associated protein
MKDLKLNLFCLLFCSFFLYPVFAHAGITTVSARLQGAYSSPSNLNGIANGKTIYLQDDQYPYMLANPGGWSGVFSDCSVKNRVILKYQESARKYYSGIWTISVPITIKKWNSAGVAILPDETDTLTVGYNPDAGTVYTDKDAYIVNYPGYRIQIIESAAPYYSGSISAVPADIILEGEIEVSRTYVFNQATAPSSLADGGVSAENTLTLSWDFLPGAEAYDVEWVHLSAYDGVSVASPDYSRSTRITTTNQYYTLNLPFDDGYIMYRVRGVSYPCADPGFRMEGAWSGSSPQVAVNNFDSKRNWTYNAAYAEDGKRKEVVSFFDGTGRQRQIVTLNNSSNVAIIGETFYDYEGRSAIQTLPTPEMDHSSALQYYTTFNRNTDMTVTQYSHRDFDIDAQFNTSDCNWNQTPGMSTSQGASNYYSPSNMNVNVGMNEAIPDSKKFPFVQSVYGRDGRIVEQSAPGQDHSIGTAHTTQMFYTSPTQQRLDRMFGNEAGYAQHYNEVAVKDANGQMSLSYLDLSGHTIATSLIGEAPANMDALASNSSVTLTEDFNGNNVFDPSAGTRIVNSYYMVSTTGTYTFSYTMTPEEYSTICDGGTYNCVYDLKLNIYDNCDNPIVDNNTPTHVLGQTYVITYSGVDFTKTFTVTFSTPGVYRVEKILSLNQAALQAALAAFQAALPGSCTSLGDINDELDATIDLSECGSCEENCAALADALGLTGGPRTDFIDSCEAHDCVPLTIEENTCDALLSILSADMKPGGQYFDDAYAGNTSAPDNGWMNDATNVWDNTDLTAWADADFRKPDGITTITNWADMRLYWQPGWETRVFATAPIYGKSSLVEFHPEYCHYDWCVTTAPGKEFDVNLFLNDDYTWANSYPAGTNAAYTDPVTPDLEGINMLNLDPYFNTSPGSGDYTDMLAHINGTTPYSSDMWTDAGATAGCTNCDQQWIIFRTMYVTYKQQYMRTRENAACGFICDNSLPPDNVADCGGATHGFTIRIPDVVSQLSSQPSSDWDDNSQTLISCNTAATTLIDIDALASGSTTDLDGCISILYGSVDITCGLVCGDGTVSYTPAQLSQLIVDAINSCISAPDFTATLDPANPYQFTVTAPASSGAAINGNTLVVNIPFGGVAPLHDTYTFSGGADNAGVTCITAQNCFCQEMDLMVSLYATTNPATSAYIVDHTTYPTVYLYMTDALNMSFGTTADSVDIRQWWTSCYNTSLGDPLTGSAPALPAALDCNNPDPPCAEDAYDITAYYAGVFYQQLVDQASQDFINGYIAHCLPQDLYEDYNVEHPDREYHFTLYYYDQAGNLVRTVPPAGVQLLDAAGIADAGDYRNGIGGSTRTVPDHIYGYNSMVTNYKYNTLNAVVESVTPDAATTTLFYDNLGRIVASQNAKQSALSVGGNHYYSYTLYDPQSRIIEAGEINNGPLSAGTAADYAGFESWVSIGGRTQVTSTYYDAPLNSTIDALFAAGAQENLRKRVATVTIEDTYDGNSSTYDHATHYTYDVQGNVKELIQEFPELVDMGNNIRYKHIAYSYDLVSGNVNEVCYQRGVADQFFHHYYYDADNRVTNVYTSRDSIFWDQDAKYLYYLHGPLGREEIGDVKVQGLDYAYTIHGWIKGVNSNILDRTKDLGKDGQALSNTSYTTRAGMHSDIATDAFGYALGYYWTNGGSADMDYISINSAASSLYNNATTLTNASDNLYNGNIKEMSTALCKANGTATPATMTMMFNRYHYDQLNRLVSSNSYVGASTSSYASYSNSNDDFQNIFSYDANGNIQTQYRNGNTTSGVSMDDLTYHYYNYVGSGTYTMNADGSVPVNASNKLAYVEDAGTPGNYTDDLEDQSAGNYTYDDIGQLTSDASEEIDAIDWNVYGKIKSVTRSTGSIKNDLNFIYDAMGNRIVKISKDRDISTGTKTQDHWTYTYYVRDAQGNVMATYNRTFTQVDATHMTDDVALQEADLYGSSRLGVLDRSQEAVHVTASYTYSGFDADNSFHITGGLTAGGFGAPETREPVRKLGYKAYELVNHLGNVLVTVSDRKLLKQNGTTIDYYTADVRSTTDYSAFGATQPGRTFVSATPYRYGFNGKEDDKETVSTGDGTQDYGMRIYNPALGRFLSVDPDAPKYANFSSYCFAANSPIKLIDQNGRGPIDPKTGTRISSNIFNVSVWVSICTWPQANPGPDSHDEALIQAAHSNAAGDDAGDKYNTLGDAHTYETRTLSRPYNTFVTQNGNTIATDITGSIQYSDSKERTVYNNHQLEADGEIGTYTFLSEDWAGDNFTVYTVQDGWINREAYFSYNSETSQFDLQTEKSYTIMIGDIQERKTAVKNSAGDVLSYKTEYYREVTSLEHVNHYDANGKITSVEENKYVYERPAEAPAK